MPLADPGSSRLFVWLVSSTLYITSAAGGICLLLYVLLPPAPSTTWLRIVGLTLLCLPFLFWLLTCFYRYISRVCGFRLAIGFGNGAGGGAGAGTGGNQARANDEPASVERGDGGDGPMVMVEQDNNAGNENWTTKGNLSASNSSNNISFRSHESELPLASSMVWLTS